MLVTQNTAVGLNNVMLDRTLPFVFIDPICLLPQVWPPFVVREAALIWLLMLNVC